MLVVKIVRTAPTNANDDARRQRNTPESNNSNSATTGETDDARRQREKKNQ
jgi:hypothetical protein